VLTRFLPRNEQFFGHFQRAADNAVEAADILVEIFDTFQDVERKVRHIRELEHRGDEVTHQIFNALNSTFVTPLDREDIQAMAHKIDNFIDLMEDVAKRITLYKIDRTTERAHTLAKIIAEQSRHLQKAVAMMENPKERQGVMAHVVEVHRLENEADEVYSEVLGSLYEGTTEIPDLIRAIRWGELYGLLEETTDQAEDVANVLEAVAMKYA
jgi:predicted phosphate transport protein (TIGR00153 family)